MAPTNRVSMEMPIRQYVRYYNNKVPEIEITIKVYMCYRCGHLWERKRGATGPGLTCPGCNSPFWDTIAKAKKGKPLQNLQKLKPLRFHGEEVLRSNIGEI